MMDVIERYRHFVKVYFDDGDHIETRINGSVADVVRYYLGTDDAPGMVRYYESDDDRPERFARARAVVFVEGGRVRRYDDARKVLKRVYRIRAGEGRYTDCAYPLRCSYSHYQNGATRPAWVDDFAYLPA